MIKKENQFYTDEHLTKIIRAKRSLQQLTLKVTSSLRSEEELEERFSLG
jgi:hypothetical protein